MHAQLEQLSTDALTAPEWIVPGHGSDEVADSSAQARSSEPGPRLPRPVQPPTLAVPPDHGFWLHDVELIAPRRPSLSEPDPEEAIRVGQAWRGIGAKDNLKLVTENEVFKRDVTTRSERDQQTAEQEGKKWKHPAG